MASIDLRDAYLHVPIAPTSQKYLRLAVKMGASISHLQFRALLFGFSSSPRIFTKIIAEALAPLKLKGISIVPYLNGLLLFARTRDLLEKDLEETRTHLESLGWIINKEKSNMILSQTIKFLGYTISSIQERFFLPEEKIEKVQKAVKGTQTNLPILIRTAMCVLGLLTYSIPAVQWARLHAGDLQQTILRNWSYGEPLEKLIRIPFKFRENYGGGGVSQIWTGVYFGLFP